MSVRLELGQVSTLTLTRPDKYNAMNLEMADAIFDAMQTVKRDPATRVLVVRGEGKAFSAGGDFDMLGRNAERPPEANRTAMETFYRRFLSVLEVPVPTLAVLHGATIGAGLCLAMACDIRLAAHEAKLGANFVRVGLHPGMGCSLMLPHLVGRTRASELLLSGRLLQGEEAERIGLVTRSAPRAALEEAVEAQVNELLQAAPIAARQLKETLRLPILRNLDQALAREAACQAVDFATRDLKEAVRAFSAGEKPHFTGE
ncbi:MAG: enoyl-CoA hydratase/isomerase family protein [Polyangiaceae bacterium]|nr:enoyl-CoA hydratase/isomerase family protein [Myxococcales bacterium]MCB9590278.1 enoyl-CoA hydratase/isomerase family protein [Polyangiaceae bacterium]MCB9605067.1 enoyl-CoA hydratase/isomerase family protein [Polyangiaceae bacterium]